MRATNSDSSSSSITALKRKKNSASSSWYRVVSHTNRPNDMSVPDVAQDHGDL